MRKSILLLLLILTTNFAVSQQRFNAKPGNFTLTNFFAQNERNIPVINRSQIYNTLFGIFEVYPNNRIFPSSVNQTTLSSALKYNSSDNIVVGANTDLGVGYYITNNGGTNWFGNNLVPGALLTSQNPGVVFDNNGKIYYNYYDNYLIIDRTTNNGSGWLGRVNIISGYPFDKNYITSDLYPSSPYYNRVYVGWTKWAGNYPIMFSYSVNGGSSYSAEQQIGSPLSGHYEQGVDIQTGPNGEVYCVWATPQITNNIEDKIGFTYSLNGGVNFSSPTTPITISGIRGTVLSSNIRVHSFPSLAVDWSNTGRNGYLYLCWAQKNLSPAGSDPDIVFSMSTNSGSTWSAPVRVNDDALNNGKPQFTPSIAVDQATGNIAIVFYDTRENITNDSCNTYIAISSNSGSSWVNIKVSDMAQKPVPLQGYATGYFSDKIDLVYHNNIVNPFWADNRNGVTQIYTTKVTIGAFIQHTPLRDTENVNGPYVINALITPFGSPLVSGETKVFWGRGGITDSIAMINTSGNSWTASITGNATPAEYRYFIKTIDGFGRQTFSPAGAPSGYHRFFAGTDTVRPVILHTPIADTPRSYWPLSVKCYVNDNIGVDSVWVKWYKNSSSIGNFTFGLTRGIGSSYSGLFNYGITGIDFGDSIFYKIFARDNSTLHNVDSSIQYKFKIKQLANVIIGSGNIISNYPFFTFYTDSRTDMLYLGSELNANGGTSGWITQLWFNFNSAAAFTINNFNIKMLQTTNSSVTGFTSSGWMTVYSGNYTIPGTGWRAIDLQNPMNWNGSNNILIEICYDNSDFSSNSNVYSSNVPNMTWHQHQDLVSGSGCTDLTGGTTQTARPNIAFTILLHIGIQKQISEIPSAYKLEQNYPNPFNPVTKIKFSIPKEGIVTLKIYDALGKEIKTLANENLNTGTYEIGFNGTNLSSGIYFYKLEVNGFSDVKRMVLIK